MGKSIVAVSGKKRKQKHVSQRRQKILDAAMTVFFQRGFNESSIVDIAKIVGVTDRTIFNYFPNKRDLLIAVVKNILASEPLLDLEKKQPSMDNPDFLPMVIKDRLSVAFDKTDILTCLMPEILRDPGLCKVWLEQFENPLIEILSKHLETKIAEGNIRELNPELVARILRGMTLGLAILFRLERKDGFMQNMPLQELTNEIVNIIMTGIKECRNPNANVTTLK